MQDDIVEKFDERRQRHYYWNRITNTTGWSVEEVSSLRQSSQQRTRHKRSTRERKISYGGSERRYADEEHSHSTSGGRVSDIEKALLEVEERAEREKEAIMRKIREKAQQKKTRVRRHSRAQSTISVQRGNGCMLVCCV